VLTVPSARSTTITSPSASVTFEADATTSRPFRAAIARELPANAAIGLGAVAPAQRVEPSGAVLDGEPQAAAARAAMSVDAREVGVRTGGR
jgi:hypothetical protein